MKLEKLLRSVLVVLGTLVGVVVAIWVFGFLVLPPLALGLLAVTLAVAVAYRLLRRRVPSRTVLELDLESGVVEHVPSHPVGRALASGKPVLRDIVEALTRAASDNRVDALVVRLGNGQVGLAQAQELRDAVTAFRTAGKRAYAFAETFGEGRSATVGYYLAATFDEVHLQPIGELYLTGLVGRTPFLRRLFDKLSIIPDFDHRREYKAAKYLLTEDHYTEPHREAATAILESQFSQIVAGIGEDRGLDEGRVRELIDHAPLLPHEAVEAGLVDAISYRDQVYDKARGEEGKLLFLDRYLKRVGRPHRKGTALALIHGVGSINRGRPRFDPLSRTSSMGADVVAEAFREAIDDKKVKAIIFRVDSPGGSAVGSEVIRREIVRAQEAGKPVVVSMGDVAGSGGYWISSTTDRIVAQPGTLTGSIGVVTGKLVTRPAWEKAGVNWDELHLGQNATIFTPDRPFTESERQRVSATLDMIYEEFKGRVGEGRGLQPQQVEDLAKGRVWTGEEAHRLGLVDELGGLERAIELARELLELEPDAPVRLVPFPKKKVLPLPAKGESSEPSTAITQAVAELVSSLAVSPLRDTVRMLPPT
ncbi:MAG: signal peptide peptidase SppA [Acidimicrobiia bacterium]